MNKSTKNTVYLALSLDGYIAKKDGSVDWLHRPEYAVEGEDMGYGALMKSIDALVMGSGTFKQVRSFEGGWPYGKTQVVVLSSKDQAIPADLSATVQQMAGTPAEIQTKLHAAGMQHLYIDGGKTVQDFLAAGLIDELILTTIPVILGEGIPFFGPVKDDIHLTHVKTEAYSSGLVQTHYLVQK
ncbi:MAG: dihydrofolate reductase family protein [Anaerolineae bacterium]